MAPTHKKIKPQSLKSGRPPPSQNSKPKTLSSKTTQAKIVKFHQLNKSLATATDPHTIAHLKSEIEKLGGLKAYQEASILGQSSTRGGDSSIVLVDWLRQKPSEKGRENLRMLEIGALSTRNACSRSSLLKEIVRIDLNSQAPGILKQDFMSRPLPTSSSSAEYFDIISLSLVLNFVPTPEGRGEMLRRTTEFLKAGGGGGGGGGGEGGGLLFLVLPAPCVLNSRYFDDERLTEIMGSLGYVELKRKGSRKLVYWLWELKNQEAGKGTGEVFGKVKVRDGPAMNNFYVELRAPGKEIT